MKSSAISTKNQFYRLMASPLFTIVFATIAFILFVVASIVDTSIPDVIATEAQHHSWVAKHGKPGDQKPYYLALIGTFLSGCLAFFSNYCRKNKYWL